MGRHDGGGEGVTFKAYKPRAAPLLSSRGRQKIKAEDLPTTLIQEGESSLNASTTKILYTNDWWWEKEKRASLDQRHAARLCELQGRRVYREVCMSIYGPVFDEVIRFLAGEKQRRSIWSRAQKLLEKEDQAAFSMTDDEDEEDDVCCQPAFNVSLQDFCSAPPGLEALLPCAVIYPNMHPTDRGEALKLLRMAVQQSHVYANSCPIGFIIQSAKHLTVAKILHDLYLHIMTFAATTAAVAAATSRSNRDRRHSVGSAAASVVASGGSKKRATPFKGGGRGGGIKTEERRSRAPAGTLNEVMAAYDALEISPRPTLLFMFEDVEALSNRLLDDLLRLFAEASTILPIRLVFFVPPSFGLAQNISSAATAALEPATFILPPSRLCFEKLLERLFVDAELPIMASGRVLRSFRIMFLHFHQSLHNFLRHLNFMLRLQFTQMPALLSMLPYKTLKGEEDGVTMMLTFNASSWQMSNASMDTIAGGQDSLSASGGGGGAAVAGFGNCAAALLRLPEPGEEYGLLLEVEASEPGLAINRKISYIADNPAVKQYLNQRESQDRIDLYGHLRKLSVRKMVGRFELRTASHLLYEVIKKKNAKASTEGSNTSSSTSAAAASLDGSGGDSFIQLYEKLLDCDRPQRWQAVEEMILEYVGELTLAELDALYRAWIDRLRILDKGIPPFVSSVMTMIPDWKMKVRDLMLLLHAFLDETTAAAAKRKASSSSLKKKVKKGIKTASGAASSSTPFVKSSGPSTVIDGASTSSTTSQDNKDEEEEEQKRLYQLKSKGLMIDSQAFLMELMTHCKDLATNPGTAIEAFCFMDDKESKASFFLEPRGTATKGLANLQHSHSLQCKCCPSGKISPSMPDICIIYSLYEAHEGRVINLRAWFASFVEIVQQQRKDGSDDEEGGAVGRKKRKAEEMEAKEGKKKRKGARGEKKEEGEEEEEGGEKDEMKKFWVRFLNAVDELEYLGFTRPYGKRSGDRVKLIYSYVGDSLDDQKEQQQREGESRSVRKGRN